MKKPQKQRIIELLADGRWHNTIEMNKIAFRYGAVLHVLRKEGYIFNKKRDENYPDNLIEMWRLEDVPSDILPPKKKYVLAPEGDRYLEIEEPAFVRAPALMTEEEKQLLLF